MILDSLDYALKQIQQDVEMKLDEGHHVDEPVGTGGQRVDHLDEPDVSMADAEEPCKEREKDHLQHSQIQPQNQIQISRENALVQDSLWPSKLGAQTALPERVHHIVEVDMPIPLPWHQNILYTVSTYIQLAFNFGILSAVFWVFRLLVTDMHSRINQKSARLIAESARCAQSYVENECRMGLTRPAIQDLCYELELCMDRDPAASVYRLSTLAQCLAETLNDFFDPLSPKVIIILLTLVALVIYFTNFAFGFIRARTYFDEQKRERLKYKLTPVDLAR